MQVGQEEQGQNQSALAFELPPTHAARLYSLRGKTAGNLAPFPVLTDHPYLLLEPLLTHRSIDEEEHGRSGARNPQNTRRD